MSPRQFLNTACLLALALTIACAGDGTGGASDFTDSGSVAAFDELPRVTNEQLGMFNYIHSISVTPPDAINAADWGPEVPFGSFGDGAPGGEPGSPPAGGRTWSALWIPERTDVGHGCGIGARSSLAAAIALTHRCLLQQ